MIGRSALATIIPALLLMLPAIPCVAPSFHRDPSDQGAARLLPSSQLPLIRSDRGIQDASANAASNAPNFPDNWAMYDYNSSRTGDNPDVVSIAPSNATNLSEIWSYRTNGSIFTSPSVVNGTVYFGSWDGYLYALNATNGSLLWRTYLGQTSVPACRSGAVQGVSSSPQFWNGSIYVGGGDSDWYALNASDGSIEWNLSVGNNSATGGNYNWASPLIYHHELYIGIASNCDHPLIRAGLMEVNLTGPLSVKAEFFTTGSHCAGDSIWSTPAVDPATNTVWITTGNEGATCSDALANSVIVLNATSLAELSHWAVPNVQGYDSDFGDGVTFGASPKGIPLALTTNKNGLSYAFNRSNLSSSNWGPAWAVVIGDFDDWSIAPSVWNGSAYFVPTSYSTLGGLDHPGSVWALAPGQGSVLWNVPSLSGDRLAPGYANGVLAVPSGENLTVLRASDGSQLASFQAGYNLTQFGPAVFGDGRLFAGTGSYSSLGSKDPQVQGVLYAFGLPLSGTLQDNLSAGPLRAPRSVQFWTNSSGGSGAVRCSWAFGDGTQGTGCDPTHVYARGGNFTVRVEMVDDAWDRTDLNTSITLAEPFPSFAVSLHVSDSVGVAPATFTFNATPEGTFTPPIEYSWQFGDGNGSDGAASRVEHLYTYPADFNATVTARDALGNLSTASAPVSVLPDLSANASLTPLSGPAPLTVRGTVGVQGGTPPYTLHWNDALGRSSPEPDFATTFPVPGLFEVTLSVVDTTGRERNASWNVTVLSGATIWGVAIEVGSPTAKCGESGATVPFVASVSGGSAPLTYRWNFGDGTNATGGPEVNHTFSSGGDFPISLEVTGGEGDSLSANTSVSIGPTLTPCKSPVTGPPSMPAAPNFVLPLLVVTVALLAAVVGWRLARRGPPPAGRPPP